MAINLKKIARDVTHRDEEIQVLALTTIGQLTASSVEDPNDLLSLKQALEQATRAENQDVVFLARKALNKVQELARSVPGGRLSATEGASAALAMPGREELLAAIGTESDPVKLATLFSQLATVAQPPDVEVAIPALKHADARVRANAVEVVERLADEQRITQILTPMLQDDNNRVRGNVAKALGRIGVPKIARYLRDMLGSNKLSMRESAVYALSHISGDPMVDLLIQALRDPYEGIRLRAVRGLKLHNDERAIAALRPLLNDLDIDVCEEARKAIRVIRKDQPLTQAGEMFDIERLAERSDRERKEAQAAAAQESGGQQALDGSIGVTSSGAQASKKQQAEALQKQAEMLLAKKSTAPALMLEGRSRLELEEMLKFELKRIGQAVFKRVRANELAHQQLSIIYYDILKFQETLKRHQERGKAEPKPGAGLFGSIKQALGKAPREEDPVSRLERRIEESQVQLGKRAVELGRQGEVEVADDDLARVGAIEEKIGQTPEGRVES